MAQQLNLLTGQPEKDDSAERDLVYGSSRFATSLVFIPRDTATDLATIWMALVSSKTWGEFRVSVGHRIYQSVLDRGQFGEAYSFESFQLELRKKNPALTEQQAARTYRALDVGDRLPCDDDPFEKECISGVEEGDWPDWPEQVMLFRVPSEILNRYGRIEESVLNGPYAVLDISRENEIVAALKQLGYWCRRDDGLIAACTFH